MKKHFVLILFFAIANIGLGYAQKIEQTDSLGLPGDNLNLYAVLDLFQKSETFEIFEKKLNEEDSKINNLDLNYRLVTPRNPFVQFFEHIQDEGLR